MYSFTLITQDKTQCTVAQHTDREQEHHDRGVLADLQGVDVGVLARHPLRVESQKYAHDDQSGQGEH